MQRWTLRITICMILGAISTVAVSWACALWSETGEEVTRFEGNKGVLSGFGYREEVHILDFRGRDANDPRDVAVSFQSRKRLSVDTWAYLQCAYSGWPFEAMYYVADMPAWEKTLNTTNPPLLSSGIPIIPEVFQTEEWHHVPTIPVWPGFLFNAVTYAVVWYLLSLSFDSIRRSHRRRKGLCPHCAYNLRNNLNSGCPECGWNRKESCTIPIFNKNSRRPGY